MLSGNSFAHPLNDAIPGDAEYAHMISPCDGEEFDKAEPLTQVTAHTERNDFIFNAMKDSDPRC